MRVKLVQSVSLGARELNATAEMIMLFAYRSGEPWKIISEDDMEWLSKTGHARNIRPEDFHGAVKQLIEHGLLLKGEAGYEVTHFLQELAEVVY